MNKLTAKQLIMLNQKIVNDEARLTSEDEAKIKDIAEIPYEKVDEFFYKYKTTVEKSAKLGCLIVSNRVFNEGNEETAMLAMLTLLVLNGYKVSDFEQNLDELSEYLNTNNYEAICSWIRDHASNQNKECLSLERM